MNRSTLVLGMLVALVGTTRPATVLAESPQAHPTRSLVGAWCVADIARFCVGVEAGGGRLAKCLAAHAGDDLLPECRVALERGGWKLRSSPAPGKAMAMAMAKPPASGPMDNLREVCGADLEKFCKDVQPGHGRIVSCLNARAVELTPSCKPRVDEMQALLAAAERRTKVTDRPHATSANAKAAGAR